MDTVTYFNAVLFTPRALFCPNCLFLSIVGILASCNYVWSNGVNQTKTFSEPYFWTYNITLKFSTLRKRAYKLLRLIFNLLNIKEL